MAYMADKAQIFEVKETLRLKLSSKKFKSGDVVVVKKVNMKKLLRPESS